MTVDFHVRLCVCYCDIDIAEAVKRGRDSTTNQSESNNAPFFAAAPQAVAPPLVGPAGAVAVAVAVGAVSASAAGATGSRRR